MPKKGNKKSNILKYGLLVVVVLILLFLGSSFVTQLGTKTVASDKIVLPPGGTRTFSMIPGMTYIEILASGPVNYHYQSIDSYGDGRGITNDSIWSGSLLSRDFTVTNNGTADVSVDLSFKTGVLNPYSFI